MNRKSQLFAVALAVACAGWTATAAADERIIYQRTYYGGLAPIGEQITTRTVVRERPVMVTKTTSVVESPAPVGELVTTAPPATAGDAIASTVTAPFRLAAGLVLLPGRLMGLGPEPIAEQVTVTKTITNNTVRHHHHHIAKNTKYVYRTTRLAPVGERTVTIERTYTPGFWPDYWSGAYWPGYWSY